MHEGQNLWHWKRTSVFISHSLHCFIVQWILLNKCLFCGNYHSSNLFYDQVMINCMISAFQCFIHFIIVSVIPLLCFEHKGKFLATYASMQQSTTGAHAPINYARAVCISTAPDVFVFHFQELSCNYQRHTHYNLFCIFCTSFRSLINLISFVFAFVEISWPFKYFSTGENSLSLLAFV
jgi:hypothetical protein